MSLIDVIQNSKWAIRPEKLDAIHQVLYRHAMGSKIDPRDLQAQYGEAMENAYAMELTDDGVAIISLEGVLARRMNMMMAFSGGTSMDLIGRDFNSALHDDAVRAIVMHVVDCPGGTVAGTEPLADGIYECRGIKPIVTFASGMMASAGYWIGSSTDRIIVEETTDVGSIGVIQALYDYSRADENAGVKRSYLYAGKYKTAGNDAEPLTQEMRDYLQDGVDYTYKIFVDSVARNLGVSPAEVLEGMADGRIFIGRQALEAGLVHEIGNMEAAINAALEMSETKQFKMEAGKMAFGKSKKAAAAGGEAETPVITREALEAEAPDVVREIMEAGAESVDLDSARLEAIQGEQVRILGLVGVQFGEESATKLQAIVESGLTVDQFEAVWGARPAAPSQEEAVNKSKMDKMLAAIQNAGPENPGHDNGKSVPANPDTEQGQDQLRAQFARDPELQAEFGGNVERYLAFIKAEKAGRVRILHSKVK